MREEEQARREYGDRVVNAYLWLSLAAACDRHDAQFERGATRVAVALLRRPAVTADFAHSATAEARRTRKAVAIEAQLRADGITVAAARTLSAASRRRIERAAAVRPASDETWERVFTFMADDEQHRPAPTVTTSCRYCGGTLRVLASHFDRWTTASHSDVGAACAGRRSATPFCQ